MSLDEMEDFRATMLAYMEPVDPPLALALIEAYNQLSIVRRLLGDLLRKAPGDTVELIGLLKAEERLNYEVGVLMNDGWPAAGEEVIQ